jgi:hypothetical protein
MSRGGAVECISECTTAFQFLTAVFEDGMQRSPFWHLSCFLKVKGSDKALVLAGGTALNLT